MYVFPYLSTTWEQGFGSGAFGVRLLEAAPRCGQRSDGRQTLEKSQRSYGRQTVEKDIGRRQLGGRATRWWSLASNLLGFPLVPTLVAPLTIVVEGVLLDGHAGLGHQALVVGQVVRG